MALLTRFREILERAGYGEFCACFAPDAPRRGKWAQFRDHASPELQTLLDVFLLGRTAPLEDLPGGLREIVPHLEEIALVKREGAGLRTNHLALYVVAGIWLFFEAHTSNPKLYFGDDSFGLLNRLRPVKGGRTLDLCAGPGVQALYCARIARSVTAVEINPLAAGLGRVNCQLNDIDNVRFVVGDLAGFVSEEKFDHVVCNPPLLPFPEDLDYPFVGHGGADGWKLVWRVLDALPALLSESGRAQIIATCLSDGLVPSVAERLERWSKTNEMTVLMPIISHQPLSPSHPYFQGLVQTTVTSSGKSYKEVARRFADHLQELRASHLCSHYLYVARGGNSLELLDLSTGEIGSPQFWFA